MNTYHLGLCIIICVVTFSFIVTPATRAQEYYVYEVQIRQDGSAVWIVTQFSSASAPVETWTSFQQKVYGLVDTAAKVTNRSMDVDVAALQINTTLTSGSKITEYAFVWLNFSIIQRNEVIFGDVFQTPGFFDQLFGDASLHLIYPEELTIKSVFPPPYERQDENCMLKWARTQDLTSEGVKVILIPKGLLEDENLGLALIALVVVVVVPLVPLGYYMVKKHRNGKSLSPLTAKPTGIETDSDKILNLLKTSGGSMRQTEIAERLGFSKAKASQLLTELENKGILARYKRGRDKIVTLDTGETDE